MGGLVNRFHVGFALFATEFVRRRSHVALDQELTHALQQTNVHRLQ